MRCAKVTIMKQVILALYIFLLPAFSGCSSEAMSCKKMQDMKFFPEQIGDKWDRSGEPRCHDYIWAKGYIHATYKHKKKSGYASSSLLKVWIIDKVSSKKAEKWLQALLNGTHTSSSIKPLYKDVAESVERRDFYGEFLDNPVTITGQQGFEKIEEIDNLAGEGIVGYTYYLYYTHGRYVIGVEDTHYLKNIEQIRREALALLENLNLS